MKNVSYAYPSSPEAVSVGHGRTGCYTIAADGYETRIVPDSRSNPTRRMNEVFLMAYEIKQPFADYSMFGPRDNARSLIDGGGLLSRQYHQTGHVNGGQK